MMMMRVVIIVVEEEELWARKRYTKWLTVDVAAMALGGRLGNSHAHTHDRL